MVPLSEVVSDFPQLTGQSMNDVGAIFVCHEMEQLYAGKVKKNEENGVGYQR